MHIGLLQGSVGQPGRQVRDLATYPREEEALRGRNDPLGMLRRTSLSM